MSKCAGKAIGRVHAVPARIGLVIVPGVLFVFTGCKAAAGWPNAAAYAAERPSSTLPIARPRNEGAAFFVAPVQGMSGQPLQLAITLPAQLTLRPSVSGPVYLIFRGLPPEISLSAGFRLKEAWAASVSDAPGLLLLSKPGYAAKLTIEATLHLGRESVPQTRSFEVTLSAGHTAALPSDAIHAPQVEGDDLTKPPGDAARRRTGTTRLSGVEEQILLRRAETLLQNGDFESARLIYAELADRGSSEGAYRMAQSFDPDVLKRFFVVGLSPELEKARDWYRRALELGASKAGERLQQLARGGSE